MNDPREITELLWQLHAIGQKLDKNYELKHYTVTDRNSIHQKYVIEYDHQKKTNESDSTN